MTLVFPAGHKPGDTYPLADVPSAAETKGASIEDRVMHARRFRAEPTGEKRAVRAGEWYLSGAVVAAYKARVDLGSVHLIARVVKIERVPESFRVVPF